MLDRAQLETFATVAEEHSFERAAIRLSITRGAVSQRIRMLEESLSAVLLVREKPVVPTPAGEILLRHVKTLRMSEGAALEELMPKPQPHAPVPLAIAVNADSLATWFPPVLRRLLLERKIALEVVTDDQDHTSARLLRGEVVGCISTDAKAATGFQAEYLGAMEYRCYAAPEFAQQYFSEGLTLAAALAAPAILFNRKDSLHDEFLERRFGFAIERYTRHYLPSPLVLLEGIAMGAGYGLVPSSQARPFVAEHRLVEMATDQPVMVRLYWHHWDLEPPIAQGITTLVASEARRQLAVGDGAAPPSTSSRFDRQRRVADLQRKPPSAPRGKHSAEGSDVPRPQAAGAASAASLIQPGPSGARTYPKGRCS